MAAEEITVRTAVPADAGALTELHLDVWDDAYTGLIAQGVLDERRHQVDDRIRRWRGILEAHDRTLVAVAPGGGLVGFASAGPARDADVGLDLELWALYVRASSWGTGVGYALLRASIGDRAAYLWVLAGNEPAIRFYERQGFRLDGVQDEQDEGRHLRMVRAGSGSP